MKLILLLLLLISVYTAHTQTRDGNKTRQIEQLQQLKQTITRKIDTLHLQLTLQADSIDNIRKKLDQLKKENNNQDKPDVALKEQASKLSLELQRLTNLANNLQKKFDRHLVLLDKTIGLQKDLEEKIYTLVRENDR